MGSNYSIPEHYKLHFSAEELEKIKETYKILAKRYDGKVLSNGVFVAHFDQQIKDEYFTTRLFHAFNMKRTGFIDIEEFSHGVNVCLRGRGAPSMELLFSFFATESGGMSSIKLSEIREVFTKSAFCSQVAASVSLEEAKNQPTQAVALHTFTGKSEKELSFEKGETLKVLKKLDSAWWWCESHATGKRGYAPLTYVKEIEPHMRPIERVVRSAEEYDKDKDGKISKTDFMLWASKCAETKAILAQLAALKINPPDPFFLSAPRGFKHLGHVGVNPETGQIEKRNIPVEWRQLFREAGITDDEIDDADTSQMLVDVVGLQVPEAIHKQTQTSPAASPRAVDALPAPPGGWVAPKTSPKTGEDSRLSLSAMPSMQLAPGKTARKRRGRSRSESNKPDFQRIQELTGNAAVLEQPPNDEPPKPNVAAKSQPSSPRDGITSSGSTISRKAPPPPVPKKGQKRAPPPPPPKNRNQSPPSSPGSTTESSTSQTSPRTESESASVGQVESSSSDRERSQSVPDSTPSIAIIPPPTMDGDDDIPPPPPPEEDDDIPGAPPPEETTEDSEASSIPTLQITATMDDSERPLQLHAAEVDLSVVTGDRRTSVVRALRKSILERRTRSRGNSAAMEVEDANVPDQAE